MTQRGQMLLLIVLGFGVLLIFLVSLQQSVTYVPVGQGSANVLNEVMDERRITFYVSQSLRNAVHTSLQQLTQDGLSFFFLKDTCSLYKGRPILFSTASCTFSQARLEEQFLSLVRTQWQTALQASSYPSMKTLPTATLSFKSIPGFMDFSGKFASPLSYQGNNVSYSFPVSYTERFGYDLHEYTLFFTTLTENLPCLLEYKAASTTQCSLSKDFTWDIQEESQLLLVTAKTQKPFFLAEHLSFAFAISLNNPIVQSPPTDPLFGG